MLSIGLLTFCVVIALTCPHRAFASRHPLFRRSSARNVNLSVPLLNDFDYSYATTITLNGEDFVVALDTGSSDLFVLSSSSLTTTNMITILAYGGGAVKGPIGFAELKLGPYTVPSQAFLNANESSGSLLNSGETGLLDVGPPDISQIQDVCGDRCAPPLSNIFRQNVTAANSISFLLSRHDDDEQTWDGSFTIAEVIPGLDAVTGTSKLSLIEVDANFPRWTVLLDSLKINGALYSLKSNFTAAPLGKAIANLDTGTTLAIIPREALDSMYSHLLGAFYYDVHQSYVVSCTAYSEVVFNFGGQDVPIHPLDLVVVGILQTEAGNSTYCESGFRAGSAEGGDYLLGDTVLRNAYAFFNFGEFDSSGKLNNPYVQLLSTTSLSKAVQGFNTTRSHTLSNLPPVLSPSEARKHLMNTSSGTSTNDEELAAAASSPADTPNAAASSLAHKLDTYGPIALGLLAGNLILGLVLCVVAVMACIQRSGKPSVPMRSLDPKYAPLKIKSDLPNPHGADYDADGYDVKYDQ